MSIMDVDDDYQDLTDELKATRSALKSLCDALGLHGAFTVDAAVAKVEELKATSLSSPAAPTPPYLLKADDVRVSRKVSTNECHIGTPDGGFTISAAHAVRLANDILELFAPAAPTPAPAGEPFDLDAADPPPAPETQA